MLPFRVMTYNVRYFGHGTRGLASTRGGLVRIANAIARLDPAPAIVCLQEVETQSLRSKLLHRDRLGDNQLDALVHELDGALAAAGRKDRYFGYYFPAHSYRATEQTSFYTTGLGVLASVDLEVLRTNAGQPRDITHRKSVGGLKQTRVCGHVAFRAPSGETVDVFNTHLSLPDFFAKRFWTDPLRMGFGDNQLEEARSVKRFIDDQRLGENVVVAGDFNSLPGSPVDSFFQEQGFQNGVRQLHQIEAYDPQRFPTAGFMNLRMHLDHIYTTPSLEWVDTAGTTPFGKPGPFHGLSDHVPILATMRPRR